MPSLYKISVLATLASALSINANTIKFQGVNWAVLGDNFVKDILVLRSLDKSDGYNTVRAKADAIYGGLIDNLGINTIRLPVNTHTVNSTWWDAYTGVIDSATDHHLNVILAYWEDGVASGGKINNLNAWNAMWDTVVSEYGHNSLIHFEPMNEPHGYSAAQWTGIAADWVGRHSSLPKQRILIGGTGYSQNLQPICDDARLDGTLLSYHVYTFFGGEKDYNGWVKLFKDGLGNCASRAVTTEFGSPMDTGLNYGDPNSKDNFVRYLRAVTDSLRELNIGSTYWPAIGGKVTQGQTDDWYSIQKLQGSGTNLKLSTPNDSGADRLFHGWGRDF